MTKGQKNYLISLVVVAIMVAIGLVGGYSYVQKHHPSWLQTKSQTAPVASAVTNESASTVASKPIDSASSETSSNAPEIAVKSTNEGSLEQSTTFPLKTSPNEILTGMCRMEMCPYAKVIGLQLLGNTHDSTTVKAKVVLGATDHPEGDYPVGIPSNIDWNLDADADDVLVVCSFSNPTVTWQNQTTVLNFREVATAWEMDANVYFAVCHNFYGGYEAGASKFYYIN